MPAIDGNGKTVDNVNDFLKNYRYRRVNQIREERGTINGVPTIEDIWPTRDSGYAALENESKTIYTYYEGVIYEITLIPNAGIPTEMMSTFHFTKPEISIEVNPPTKKQTDYINNELGFKITFPSGWHFPSPDDRDPHIYNCPTGKDCNALEIQHNPLIEEPSLKYVRENIGSFGKNARIINLIPEAVVIRADVVGPAKGWTHQYTIYFKKNRKAFTVFTNNIFLEKSILSSMSTI